MRRAFGLPAGALALAVVVAATPAPVALPAGLAPAAAGYVGSAAPSYTPAQLAALRGALDAATAAADQAAAALDATAGREGVLREAVDDADVALEAAQGQVDAQLRAIYEAGPPSPWATLLGGASPADLAAGPIAEGRSVGVGQAALAAMAQAQHRLSVMESRAAGYQSVILARARVVFAAQARARALLATAEQVYAADQAALARLQAEQAALDSQAQQVSALAAPAVTPADLAAAAAQAPLVAQLENTPSGYLPAGYHATGQVLTGIASWYGPGFIGNPTSSGAPYDPEAYTAAMLDVPLGTVVHVVGPQGTSVNLLVNDHGPYVGGRLIDLSEAAAGALGIGLAPVTILVLAPD